MAVAKSKEIPESAVWRMTCGEYDESIAIINQYNEDVEKAYKD